jgi:hypothetical protein
MGLVGIFICFVGGTIRYIYGYSIRKLGLTSRKYYSYKEYLNGPDEPEDFIFDTIGHEFVNKVIGMVTIVILCGLIIVFF